MERMTIQILKRDFSASAPDRLDMQVEQLNWKAQGGPAKALITGSTKDEGWGEQAAQWAQDALRCPVEICSQSGEKTWWGYVHRVEVQRGGFSLVYDLSVLANRICVQYWQREPQLEWSGVKTFTPWLDDLESQRVYGVKERIYRLGSLDETQALQMRGALLAENSRPQAQLAALDKPVTGVKVLLECRGWWETLTWKTAHFTEGYEGHVRPAQGTQSLGRSNFSDARIAQSFSTGYGDWKAGEAVVNLRGVGMNSDLLRCELCDDASGVPGSVLASAEVDAAVVSGARWWVKFVFSPRVAIEANNHYWLVLSRSGMVSSANYFQVYLDSSDGYAGGRLMTWNGSAWLDAAYGLADINFYVVGYVSRLARISELAGAELGGQFLTGLKVDSAVSGDTLLWREGIHDCGEELVHLLQTGEGDNLLYARVDAGRRLVVSQAPGAWLFSLDGNGVLRTRSGREACPADLPAGERSLLASGWDEEAPVIQALEWTPQGGLRVKW